MGCKPSKSPSESNSADSAPHIEQNGEESDRSIEFKITLVGAPGVGKSSLLYQFTERKPYSDVDADVREREWTSRIVEVLNHEVELKCWDTVGEEKYKQVLI
eukprot:TRINITY_DN5736_c0_g1_i1.p1 TRINITY_DN5736_c0_g1~~TRINITY_DN5736_c0_g1_i1.p1  ORF type:complete len:102 (-),score=25.12 TRINITY_DN5736_c0_g1_i1:361-666(-)